MHCYPCATVGMLDVCACCVFLQAQVVAVFDDHDLWYPDHRDYPLVYVTQDWLASYCRVSTVDCCCCKPCRSVTEVILAGLALSGVSLTCTCWPMRQTPAMHAKQLITASASDAPHSVGYGGDSTWSGCCTASRAVIVAECGPSHVPVPKAKGSLL